MSDVCGSVAARGPARRRAIAAKPAPDEWPVTEVMEHLVLAEHRSLNKMWRAGAAVPTPVWDPSRGCLVPHIAAPRNGGRLAYWLACLRACQPMLESLGPLDAKPELP